MSDLTSTQICNHIQVKERGNKTNPEFQFKNTTKLYALKGNDMVNGAFPSNCLALSLLLRKCSIQQLNIEAYSSQLISQLTKNKHKFCIFFLCKTQSSSPNPHKNIYIYIYICHFLRFFISLILSATKHHRFNN